MNKFSIFNFVEQFLLGVLFDKVTKTPKPKKKVKKDNAA